MFLRSFHRKLPLLVGLLGALLTLWTGCGTPTERYKVLSFFFDGVPDPNAPVPAPGTPNDKTGAGASAAARRVIHTTHKPYAEQKCDACHTNTASLSPNIVNESVCLTCHKQKTQQYRVMHGPVAAGACLWCHDPHDSPQPHLLKAAAPKLCLQCHERGTLPSQPPEHSDKDKSCLDCHAGHGGEKHGLLRAATTQPATQPAPATQPTTAPAPVPGSGLVATIAACGKERP